MSTPLQAAEEAATRFSQGASCAQAVLAACAPSLGLDAATAMRLASGLGAGLGGLRETCGAVTAMAAVLSLRHGPDTPMDAKTKAALYKEIQDAVADFDAEFGTHTCLDLLKAASIEKQAGVAPEARTAEYYAKRPCARFVRFCAGRALQ